MNIHINDKAHAWYKEELDLKSGDYLRFFARYGGSSTVQKGFSLGISNEEPHDLGVETTKDGIHYYIEKKDLWYFDDKDLFVEFNEKAEEPVFKHE
ncbi:HesB/YadR/YfhF family protein [Bacillus sp. 31A1R]|uniref:HesB/YadR/YfhF family protein n=1 Tax=Robertmurraya mangrovi TaxID=3098077 RepID=A0ABU5J058_9BACI|nr:HesB/YadR/YfhF family protein [Bacillus sp. 31A1R]MDZ5472742.1 HesB/YadR/YfhF family protein [Bacillus sp. 31A1R]